MWTVIMENNRSGFSCGGRVFVLENALMTHARGAAEQSTTRRDKDKKTERILSVVRCYGRKVPHLHGDMILPSLNDKEMFFSPSKV